MERRGAAAERLWASALTDLLDSLYTLAVLVKFFKMQQSKDLSVLEHDTMLKVRPLCGIKS